MLARLDEPLRRAGFLKSPNEKPAWQFDGFISWLIVLVKPPGEIKVAARLNLVGAPGYVPTYTRSVHFRGKLHVPRLYAAISGLIFMPQVIVDSIHRRDELFELIGVSGFAKNGGRCLILTKADIEKVRVLEARVNLPPEAKGTFFKVGQQVRFKDGSEWQSWGGGIIIKIVDEARIVVDVPKLFGRTTSVTVPASEIEAK